MHRNEASWTAIYIIKTVPGYAFTGLRVFRWTLDLNLASV